jgi:hypothetical protein
VAARLLRLRHERSLLRPSRHAITPKIQRSAAHRVHPRTGFQHVRLKTSGDGRMGRQAAGLGVGPDAAAS